MAKQIILDAQVTINSVDLTDHVQKVTVDSKKDTIDVTSMGAASKEYLLGLGDGTIQVTFFQDYAAGSVDATLQPLHTGNSVFPIEVIPQAGAVSPTNPSFSGTFILPEYQPISGGVGDASMMDVTFQNASQSGITRGTA
jgi:hypothetical protein